jgi:hypothetical protein
MALWLLLLCRRTVMTSQVLQTAREREKVRGLKQQKRED